MSLQALVDRMRASRGFRHKTDIAGVVASLASRLPNGTRDLAQAVAVGDDCAALADGDGYLLFAIEGLVSDFVETMPWFAGYSSVMVNISDVYAMGGRPLAVVDALWSDGLDAAAEILAGIAAASNAYGVPVVGGHSNTRSAEPQPAPTLDFDIGAATTPGGQAQPFKPGDTLIIQAGEAPPPASAAAQAKSETLDFDISALDAPPAQPAQAPAPAPEPKKDQGASLDFDLDLDLGTAKPAPAAAAPVDITTISLDLGKPGSGAGSDDPRWQEVATKLDLAKAYQGMGDKDGARELLNEVISQGDSAQQNEAKQMLAALG